jgi:uncharacterized protein
VPCSALQVWRSNPRPQRRNKIAKAGNVITLYYSANKLNWLLIRHLQFDSTGPLKLGFLAQSPTGRRCQVTFSDIHYSTRKIADPYLGE